LKAPIKKKEKKKSLVLKRGKAGTHSIVKFNKTTFFGNVWMFLLGHI